MAVRVDLALQDLRRAGHGQRRHLLAQHFAKWQLPERYEFIDAVPRTSTGKFWKLKLRERFPA